jgi:hypothetical protein
VAIEGTGIKAPSKKASRMAMATYRVDPLDKLNRDIEKNFRRLSNQESTGAVKETGRGMGDRFNPFADRVDASDQIENRPSFFSPGGGAFDERNDVQIASTDLATVRGGDPSYISSDVTGDEEGFNQYLKRYYGTDMNDSRYQNFGGTLKRIIRESYNEDKQKGRIKFEGGTLINQKPSFLKQTQNFAGSVFDAITGTQGAEASQIPGGLPSGNQFSPSGDTSFSSFRMGGGVEGQQSGIVTPFSQTSMGKGEPRNITKFQDTSMGRRPVSNLPSDYKQTEAREFAKAKAYQQANKNPNVTTDIDSRGQVTVSPVQRGRGEAGTSDNTAQGNQARVQQNAKARAQAAAYNRRISGKSISQTKADNKAAVRKSAAERQAAFKKTGKSTVSARRAAAKASVKAAAKKRNAAFKARRKARTRRSTRGRRGRGRGRGR